MISSLTVIRLRIAYSSAVSTTTSSSSTTSIPAAISTVPVRRYDCHVLLDYRDDWNHRHCLVIVRLVMVLWRVRVMCVAIIVHHSLKSVPRVGRIRHCTHNAVWLQDRV